MAACEKRKRKKREEGEKKRKLSVGLTSTHFYIVIVTEEKNRKYNVIAATASSMSRIVPNLATGPTHRGEGKSEDENFHWERKYAIQLRILSSHNG